MKASEIQTILERQITDDGIQRIAINGDWGVGKTYQISKFIEKHQKDKNLKIIRVSLFGKKSIDDINNVIYGEIGKSKKFFKHALNFLSHVAFSYKFVSFSIPDMSHWIGEAKFKAGKKVLIVFDDYERKDSLLSTKSILGYIDNLCAYNSSVKVVLLMCRQPYGSREDNEVDIKVFDEFKEKTFNRIIDIDAVDDNVIDSIVEEFASKYNLKNDIKEYIKKHFRELKSNNLRILLEILSELSSYLNSKDIVEVLKGDSLKILINCLFNIIYDCKTNIFLDVYENRYQEMIKNGKLYGSYFDEFDDETTKRVHAIMSKCNLVGVNSNKKQNIIETILKRYLYLDKSYDKLLKKHLTTKNNNKDIYQPLFLFSDKERKSRFQKQYNDIIKTKKITNIAKIMNDWYDNLDLEFINQNLDLDRLTNALIEGQKKESFYLFKTNITLNWNGYRHPVKTFIEDLNKKLYNERINLVCDGLSKKSGKEWVHLVEYILQYKEDISCQKKIDSRIEQCFEKNQYFVTMLKGNITQDDYENLCRLVNFYKKECSASFNSKFNMFLDNEISNTSEKSYAQKLGYMKEIGV